MDDLVAELTLKLRNEMNAGLDEVRSEFFALDGTLQQLRDVLGGFARHFTHRTRARISPSSRFSFPRMIFDNNRIPSRWHRPHRRRRLRPLMDDIGNRSASSRENIK